MTNETGQLEKQDGARSEDSAKPHDQDHAQQSQAPKEDEQSPEAKRKAAKRKTVLIWVGSVLALVLIIWGIYHLIWAANHQETDDAYITGNLHPISARVAGTITQVLVDDNQHVGQGQTLVLLDPKDLQVRAEQAAAELEQAYKKADTAQAAISNSAQNATAETVRARGQIGEAKASIAAQKAKVTETEASVASAQAHLDQTSATLMKDKKDFQRYEDLAAKEQVSRQALDHAKSTYEVSVATHTAAEQSVGEAQAKLLQAKEEVGKTEATLTSSFASMEAAKAAGLETNVRSGDFETAKAGISQAKAALDEAKLQLSYTTITAPVAGRIGRKSAEAGQRVQVGQPLMAVVEDDVWVIANFKETQLSKMQPHQEVDVVIDTFPKHVFHGRLDSVAPGSGNEFALLPPDNATGNFTKIVQRIPVKIVFDKDSTKDYADRLVAGMSATVTVTTR